MKFVRYVASILYVVFLIFFFISLVQAQNCSSKEGCEKLIKEYEQKLSGIRDQKNTLSSQIQFMDTQIYLTGLRIQDTEQKIKHTEEEIEKLSGKIEGLNTSLDHLSKLLVKKIEFGYKRREIPIISFFLDFENASKLLSRMKYAKTSQENDRRLAYQVQQAKLNFEEQKDLREQKKVDLNNLKTTLDKQRVDLDNQKSAKQKLLTVTQNDERTYQNLLARTKAEYAAIQGIVAGAGTEEKIRDVKRGDVIASLIPGASCNSSGTHLHFTVLDGSSAINPFDKLRDIGHTDNSGGDVWNPHGDWDWPLSPTIEFNQGYGSETSFIKSGAAFYPSHNGIDVYSSSSVFAVADGELFRGSYAVGCTLSYAKLKHKDSNLITLYLHVYPQ